MYLNGIPVAMIAKTQKKSRWGIYLALKECGVDTSLGRRGSQIRNNIVFDFLDKEWLSSGVGRSPKQIAQAMGVPVAKVNSAVRSRNVSLRNLAIRMPMDEVLTGDDFVDFQVDAYCNKAIFYGKDEFGQSVEIEMSAKEMTDMLLKMQTP